MTEPARIEMIPRTMPQAYHRQVDRAAAVARRWPIRPIRCRIAGLGAKLARPIEEDAR
jgi:hypothetical protein